jgi:alpha-tubulin suppressor-like RCC1 family protein
VAIKKDGTLWAWGDNSEWQIGDGSNEAKLTPVKVMNDVAGVTCAGQYTEALKNDGTLWAWGYNVLGQLGDGTINIQNNPVKVMDDVVSVTSGDKYTMAVKEDGTLWSWGENYTLGYETTATTYNPAKVMSGIK